MNTADPQISIDRQWRKSRVFHILYTMHYSDAEKKIAAAYVNDPDAKQTPFDIYLKGHRKS